jgi:cellulose synthase/poly-beta-1,6-N-acetylglucosamine synthase-like glycosyltransferase
MVPMHELLTAVFWLSAGLVFYAYAGYPVLIWLLSRRAVRPGGVPAIGDTDLPSVSLMIAAYNEEDVIGGQVRSALALDYPREKLEVVVGSDGSTDGTAAAVRGHTDPRVRLIDYTRRRGKASVLNSALPELQGEVVVLSDANTRIDPGAVRRLVRWFQDPAVGAVCGRLVLTDPRTGRNVDSLYWRYETFLKRCESRLGALLGANGAIYAIRRSLFEPIPPETIVDDFVIPLLARLKTGCAIVYDGEAVAREETPPDVGSEFHRRARIGAGGFQSIGLLWRLLDPRQGWIAFTFFSHKVLRWTGPFCLVGLAASNVLLAGQPLYQALLLGQAAFYLTALLGALVPGRARP